MATQEEDPMIGTQVGNYVLIRVLGRGAMGMVYLGQHFQTEQKVAVKFLSGEFTSQTEFVNRFINEAAAAAALTHDNIIHVYEAGQDNGNHYMVMEYVEGKDLGQYLEVQEKLKEVQVLPWLKDTAKSLSYAHSCGIVHRDLKPANIMITKDGKVKLADLGLLKNMDTEAEFSLTMSGTVIGTPYYISPEQARNAKHVDLRTDIYSLGATFYHLTTGKPPFQGNSAAEIMAKHMNEQLVSPQRKNPALSDGFCDLIVKMLEKDVSKRFQSMDEVVGAIERIEKGEKIFEKKFHLKDSQLIHGTPSVIEEEDASEKRGKFIKIGALILSLLLLGLWWINSPGEKSTSTPVPEDVSQKTTPPPVVPPVNPPAGATEPGTGVVTTEPADPGSTNPPVPPAEATPKITVAQDGEGDSIMNIKGGSEEAKPTSDVMNWVDIFAVIFALLGIPAARSVGFVWGCIRAIAFWVAVIVSLSAFNTLGIWGQGNLALGQSIAWRSSFLVVSMLALSLAWVSTNRLRGHQKQNWQTEFDRLISTIPGLVIGAAFSIWFIALLVVMGGQSLPASKSWVGSRVVKQFKSVKIASKFQE